MVEEARLESVYTPKVYHEFESRSLRKQGCKKAADGQLAADLFFSGTHLERGSVVIFGGLR